MSLKAIIFIGIVVIVIIVFCSQPKTTYTRKDTKTPDRRNGNSINDKMYNAQANTKTKTTYTNSKFDQKRK